MKTEIVCIIDRSGSMASIKDDAIGGFNAFLETQKAQQGEALMTLILFDQDMTSVYEGVPLADVAPLTGESYVPRGYTALLDAVGSTIDAVGCRLASTPEQERPDQVVVVILTDGEENASKHYSQRDVYERIKHQREVYSWEFLFLGANIDAEQVAESIAIARSKAYTFESRGRGSSTAYQKVSTGISGFRKSSTIDDSWKD
jgi:uncharacterized protein YegL